ncbi:hypothetical protein EIP91_006673 [Steccherinum ochraceum]|uniref:Uncharacterized protein n=1 Tax=Steccherinum ochraceum TaxID=92696 RepID=A0A4R0RPL4_9APHY|nr:hypothetical protein EIP91_006673 [Steccherinum ochraceum]
MRRLTALFVPKRSAKSDAGSSIFSDSPASSQPSSAESVPMPGPNSNGPSKPTKARSGFFRSLSRNGGTKEAGQPAFDSKAKRHPMPSLTTDPSSSASSSSGGPHTPDDDRASMVPPESYRIASWSQSAGSTPTTPDDPRLTALDEGLKLLPPVPSLPQILHDDTDDDSSSDGSSESEAGPPVLQRSHALSPLSYFQQLTANSVAPPFSPPPVLHIPACPVYPRSCNSVRVLSPAEGLRSLMFKKRLLRQSQGGLLSPSESASLAAFGTRSRAPTTRRPSLNLDDNAVRDAKYIEPFSRGLRWWADRPCFEERNVLYMRQDGTGEIQMLRITGSDLGVAALEFSEGLEALVGLESYAENIPLSTSPVSLPPTPPAAASSSAGSSPAMVATALPPPAQNKAAQPAGSTSPNRNSFYKAAPSPLRMEHTTSSPTALRASLPASPVASASTPTIVLSPDTPEQRPRPLSQPPVKHGVRFAEEDKKEDSVPLGYVMRIKQKREEKARFLQLEKERRIIEEERWRHEVERRKQEEEKLKWQKEREQWNRERKVIEEEKKKKLYAEELVAARARREGTRVGAVPKTTDGSPVVWDGDRERERERRGREAMPSYMRPLYDNAPLPPGPKRVGSEPNVALASGSRNGSPGSSRPPSVGGSANGSVRGSSRPPSMYSTPPSSATDMHSRERRESKASKRTSMASESSQWTGMNGAQYSPQLAWGINPAMLPPVPPMPMMPVMPMMPYAVDMPLLPPAPPFMMQQYGPRRPSSQQRSHSHSPTMGNRSLATQSSERVNVHSSSQPSSPNGRSHERRSSGDMSDPHKSKRMTGSPAQSPSQSPSSSQHPDRRSISSSAHRQQPSSHRSGVSGPPSSRKIEPSSHHGHRSSNNSRPANIPRTSTMPAMPIQGMMPSQQHMPVAVPYATPTPVLTSSWTQPAFQNLSRPSSNRRQTMIS